MMHRFAMPDLGVVGHDPIVLAGHLEYLRRRSYTLMSMTELLNRLDEQIPLEDNALVFTVDDGYEDFAEVGAPVFARYDCPVTVFLVTDFIAGRIWNWFDRVAWMFAHTPRREVSIDISGERVRLWPRTETERKRSSDQIIRRCKAVNDDVKEQLLADLAAALEVDIPDRAPKEYQAMSWDEVRACSHRGVTFGPHTISHPILSQVGDGRAAREISESWLAVRDATDAAVPVFCYPNGGSTDFSGRDKALVSHAGMKAAVSGMGGCVDFDRVTARSIDRVSLPRFPYFEQKSRFVQVASGIEAMKTGLRKPFLSG